jgi:peptide/nickel transport system substrate-binding protein
VSPTVWRFKLREGVKFQNGNDFTADDVVFSWQRANTPGGLIMTVINEIKDIRKVDDLTVDVETKNPFPILLSVLTYFYMMDKEWAEANGATVSTDLASNKENFASRNANGTGPFVLGEREVDVKTVVTANPDWWDTPKHNLTEITFAPIKSDATRTSSLLSGAIDATVAIPLQDIPRVEADPNLQVIQGPELRTIYLGMDVHRDELLYSDVKGKNPLKDKKVREAIYRAIDIEAIKRSVMRGQSWPAGMIMSPFLTGAPQDLNDRLPYDPEMSKSLLTEAGYPDGFSVGLSCPNDRYVYDENICLAIISMLAKVGIEVQPQLETRAKWIQRVNALDVSMFMMGHAGLPTADAYSTLSEAIATREGNLGGLNAGRYSNPEFDALLKQIQQEIDEEKRKALIHDAVEIVRNDIAFIPLHQQPIVWASKKGIDLKQAPDNRLRLWYVTVN